MGETAGRQIDLRRLLETTAPVVTLVILIAATAIIEKTMQGRSSFLSIQNALIILKNQSFVGIIALGMTLVIIAGGIDLSVGSLVAFLGTVGVWMMNTAIDATAMLAEMDAAKASGEALPYSAVRMSLAQGFISTHLANSELAGVLIAVVVMLALGTLAGFLNGLVIARGRVAPFIATLGGLAAYRSLALSLADGSSVVSSSKQLFPQLANGGLAIPGLYVRAHLPMKLPYPVIALFVLAIVVSVILNRMRFGRYVYALGSNERATRYSGINVVRIRLMTYSLVGMLCGVSALLVASWQNSIASAETGSGYELDVIAAVVIGGTRMSGGAGSIFGTIVGVLILGVIGSMLNFLNVSNYLQGLVKGIVIVAAVLLQRVGRSQEQNA